MENNSSIQKMSENLEKKKNKYLIILEADNITQNGTERKSKKKCA